MNNINLIGRITKKPELKYTQTNKAVCNFDIAVNRYNDETDFINVQVWNVQAENLCKYQDKGSQIAVNGNIRVDKYQNDQGENRYKTYVLANNIEYLSSKTSTEEVKSTDNSSVFAEFGDSIEISEEDIAF